MYVRSALSSAAVLLLGAAALAGCRPGSAPSASSSAPSRQAGSPSAAGSAAPSASPSSEAASASAGTASKGPGAPRTSAAAGSGRTSGSTGGTSGGARSTGGTSASGGATGSGGGYATSDGYAWKHPCGSRQISVHVVRRTVAPTQRVIEVRNNGARSCGLSYYPHVVLWDAGSATGGVTVVPLVPDGLGGAPAYAVYAGRTAYAVVDLDPSGATEGTAFGVDTMNVLADGDHMSSRETLSFPLGPGAHVRKPKSGLYEVSVADAVTSMESADIHP